MRIRHSKTPLPELFHPLYDGILAEASVRVTKHSRLRAKILVFRSNAAMKTFWKEFLDIDCVCRKTRAIVNPLGVVRTKYRKDGTVADEFWEADPRYFCIMGFIQKHLRMEIICHEAVHAGFAYLTRQTRRQWSLDDALDEEEVAYPTGIIASLINKYLHEEGLYPKKFSA